jgi:hypothetical protein
MRDAAPADLLHKDSLLFVARGAALDIKQSNKRSCRDTSVSMIRRQRGRRHRCDNSTRLAQVLFRREKNVLLANHLPSLIVRLLRRPLLFRFELPRQSFHFADRRLLRLEERWIYRTN